MCSFANPPLPVWFKVLTVTGHLNRNKISEGKGKASRKQFMISARLLYHKGQNVSKQRDLKMT